MAIGRWALSLTFLACIAVAACGGDVTSGGNATCPAVPLHCNYGCRYGVVGSDAPLCENGRWVCPSPGPACIDGGSSDDGGGDATSDAPVDVVIAFDAASIACGPTLVCSNDTQFCQESSGGPPPPPDSGPGIGYGCETFPAACANDRSCACLSANNVCSGALVDCRTTGAGITVSCAFP
jgi:hypothetical protein